jgi:hypothetical protein
VKKILALVLLLASMSYAQGGTGSSGTMTLGDLMTETYQNVAGYLVPAQRYTVYDSTWVIDEINAASRNVACELLAIPRDTFISINDSTEFYDLPGDFYAIGEPNGWVSARKGGTALDIAMDNIDPKAVGKTRQANTIPKAYIVHGAKIQIIPCNDDSDSVHIVYFARANVLDSVGDTSNITSDYQTDIALRASQALILGKLPVLTDIDKLRVEGFTARQAQEDARLKNLGKTLIEALPK